MDAGRAVDKGKDLSSLPKIDTVDDLDRLVRDGYRGKVRLNTDVDVYRVYGGGSPKLGRSWTTADPKSLSWLEYKSATGLGDWNTMTDIVKGRIKTGSVIEIMPSKPAYSELLGPLPGGLSEVRVSPSQIQVIEELRWFW